MKHTVVRSFLVGLLFSLNVHAAPEPLSGWGFWSRTANGGSARTDTQVEWAGKPSVRIEHQGLEDWSYQPREEISVREGDLLELKAQLRVEGEGHGILCFVTYGPDRQVIEWSYNSRTLTATPDWKPVKLRCVVPKGVTAVKPRLIGNGPATVWLAGLTLDHQGNVLSARPADLPKSLTFSNTSIALTFNTTDLSLVVQDHRSGNTWHQTPLDGSMLLRNLKAKGNACLIELEHLGTGLSLACRIELEANQPEFTVSLDGTGEMLSNIVFPHPFTTDKGTELVIPMNEGISYPVDDPDIPRWELIAYGGHGICMPFWGVSDGNAGLMAIFETPDDAAIKIDRLPSGLHYIAPVWNSQKGDFGYVRKLRYVVLESGGHVAIAKRYRRYAKAVGLLKSFTEKRTDRPAIDLLIGAANIWYWGSDPVKMAGELQQSGIQRLLWSNQGKPESIAAMNALPHVLTSRYDIYQDVMDPANFPRLRYTHPDWPTTAWPKDLSIRRDGSWEHGWEIEAKDKNDKQMIPCGVVCDRQAIAFAIKRIGDELKTHPYRCRFIDTTTASPWRECYSPEHPMTRSDSRKYKVDLLAVVSRGNKLVCGSETGHDAVVPVCDYFEGMLSLGPYRVPDAGRDMARIYTDVPPKVAQFQVGQKYRLPLWELVYHDCVVAQWYWGDYNNKLPAIWDKRDCFNALYGTPPMFMFSRDYWEQNRARFVRSYQATSPIARATGYSEMIDHQFLSPDRNVQQTSFANGVKVIVNFGAAPYRLPDGKTLEPMGIHSEGIPNE